MTLQVVFAWGMTFGLIGLCRSLLKRENRVVRYISDSSYWLYIAHLPLVLLAIESAEREVPDYMNVNHQKMQGTFMQTPKLSDVPYPVTMEPNLVIEFYSR